MDRQKFIKNYWEYYLILEERFVQSTRYIAPVAANENTYSLEYAVQIQTIGSEIDTVMRAICGFEDNSRKCMRDYYFKIISEIPDIKMHRVKCYDFEFKPFGNWTEDKPSESLFWWKTYNHIKHGRVNNFKEANMKTTMYSLSALCLLELLYLKKISKGQSLPDRPYKESEIFIFPDMGYQCINFGNGIYGKTETP